MIERRLDLLQQLPIFGGVTDKILGRILARCECVRVFKGELFFKENDHPDGMFVLETGSVDIFKTHQGDKYYLSQLNEGDCFGEMALIDMSFRSASVRAINDCQAIKIPTKTFTEIAVHDLEQFALIQMNMGREICRRLRIADDKLFNQLVKNHQTIAS
ncbi:MAG: cyclic nucleotide-binding domain-containing protein [Lentisphaerales bacterium]|nr:cyclic nucleotide-binding domain-containing protein [Lentisphaerales bacterium]